MSKKIVFLITSLNSGGAERVTANLVNSFILDYEVHLILLYNEPLFYKIDKSVIIYYLNTRYTPCKTVFHAITQNVLFLKKIIKIFRLNKYDVVISFTTTVNVLSIFAARYMSVPCILSERNNPEVYVVNAFWRILRNFSYSLADGLVVQTNLIKKFYEKKIKADKIIVIPNPIEVDMLSLNKFYGERSNIILTVGRLDDNKNQRLLIHAFSNLNLSNWKLVVVGDGVLREVYKKLVKDLHIEQKVEFVGNVQNVWDYYNQAKIFAFTSSSEGFPNALLEAMSFGLPCISTDCPSGPSEIITNDENGYLIEVNNRAQLEDRLSKLINNPQLCKEFSSKAITSIEKFKMEEIYKQWETLILNLT